MNKLIQQEDHLILPKSTLMRFVDDKNEISVLDLNDFNRIVLRSDKPRLYHTKKDYFNPEYDDNVKKLESQIGVWNKRISKVIDEIESNETPLTTIDGIRLRAKIIEFATIEFHRLVIVDDNKLMQFRDNQRIENDLEDVRLLKTGNMTHARIEYSTNFRKRSKSLNDFRCYAQNILGIKNSCFSDLYGNFLCRVLYIPKGENYSFWLPPMHFVGNEYFLLFVFSPDIAVELYSSIKSFESNLGAKSAAKKISFCKADKTRVEIINTRAIECIGCMPKGFMEIIGNKPDLIILKDFIERLRNQTIISKNSVSISGLKEYLYDDISVYRTAVILYFLCDKPSKKYELVIDTNIFEHNYLKNDKNKEIFKTFMKYGFELSVERLEDNNIDNEIDQEKSKDMGKY